MSCFSCKFRAQLCSDSAGNILYMSQSPKISPRRERREAEGLVDCFVCKCWKRLDREADLRTLSQCEVYWNPQRCLGAVWSFWNFRERKEEQNTQRGGFCCTRWLTCLSCPVWLCLMMLLLSTPPVKGGWCTGDISSSFVLWRTSAELKIGFVMYFLTFSSLSSDRLCLSRELLYNYCKRGEQLS